MLRTIRSYVRRASRITSKQAQAIAEDTYYTVSLQAHEPLDLEKIFGRPAPKVLEIGFGMGQSLVEMAAARPEVDFLGLEVHRPGVGATIVLAKEKALTNLRIIEGDAVQILDEHLPPASLDKIQIFFPDPWPKKRHHKRRLIQADTVGLIISRLKPKGILHVATDWQDYAKQIMSLLSAKPELENAAGYGIYAINSDRPLTKFECRGQNLGHQIWDLIFVKGTSIN